MKDAERKMKSDIASVVNYFEESDLTDEELINLSKDMERISKQYHKQKITDILNYVKDVKSGHESLEKAFPKSRSFTGARMTLEELESKIEKQINNIQPD